MLVKTIIENRLSINIRSVSPISGGDINEAFQIDSSEGLYFAKINNSVRFPKMFEREAEGLKKLKDNGVRTPNVIDSFQFESTQFLVLEFIMEERSHPGFWDSFAVDLAGLHKGTQKDFGLEINNYIGSLTQDNGIAESWEGFFINNRLKPLIQLAYDQGNLNRQHLNYFENFFKVFSELIPVERPALLHGDLWSGNLLCAKGQNPVFIDPAVYYGHREMDLSMTQMFGGFSSQYLDKYNEIFPLEAGFINRIPIHNLYPSLVHLVLFGNSYLTGIESVIKKYGKKN